MNYTTNSRWKKFKNGFANSNFKLYIIILLILTAIIVFALCNIDVISNMVSSNESGDSENDSNVMSEASSENESEYTTSAIEQYASYSIRINKAANFITVYKLDASKNASVYKTFRCSVNPTVETGKFTIYEKSIWRRFESGGYGQYSSRIASNCYIHSVPYYSQNSNALNVSAYNNLGKPASIGYIYLASADAQWIYENCGKETSVEIYEQSGETPEIELAELASASNNGYDPTDTTLNLTPVPTRIKYMTGVKESRSIASGTVFNMWEGVYAVDTDGNDITEYITVTGNVNSSVPGTYTLIYHLKDNYGTNLAYYSYVTVY